MNFELLLHNSSYEISCERRTENKFPADAGFLCDTSPVTSAILKKRLIMHPVLMILSLQETGGSMNLRKKCLRNSVAMLGKDRPNWDVRPNANIKTFLTPTECENLKWIS